MTRVKKRKKENICFFVVVVLVLISLIVPSIAQAALYEVVQLTEGIWCKAPLIDGDRVIWPGFISYSGVARSEFFLYDILAGLTTQLTNDGYDKFMYQIDRDRIVWSRYSSPEGGPREIYLYDIPFGITAQVTNSSYDDWAPQIDGDNVVWVESKIVDGFDSEVLVYDIQTGSTTRITNNSYLDSNP